MISDCTDKNRQPTSGRLHTPTGADTTPRPTINHDTKRGGEKLVAEAGLPVIPWRYEDLHLLRRWLWETPHFVATITNEGPTFAWDIGDLIVPWQGEPRILAEGYAGDFTTAEREVRETVGKSYPPALGYRRYAGSLATTFTIATGERVDLGEFNGTVAVVTVRDRTGHDHTLVGHVRVVHYELLMETTDGRHLRILPAHIIRITSETGGGPSSSTTHTGVGRLYHGHITPGCTGHPGYLPGTVDHSGETCPVHEAAAR